MSLCSVMRRGDVGSGLVAAIGRETPERIDTMGGRVRTNVVLVDFENVQPTNLRLLQGGPFKIKVFLGANQTKIPLELAHALQGFGADAEYIQSEGHGRNALDFHIAYYLGRLSAEWPTAYFHVISKDSGFDPLVAHLREQGVSCQRSPSIADIPLIKLTNAATTAEKANAVIDNLVKHKAAKPRTLKTLGRAIQTLFGNQLSDDELARVLDQLAERSVVTVADGKVVYVLPS